jgi:hypothetical protein
MTTITISMRPSVRSSLHPSLRPTFVPSSRVTLLPALTGSYVTEPPTTQRSATVHPRFEAALRHEAADLLAVMRLNVDFVQSLLASAPSALALAAIDDLHDAIDRLEQRFVKSPLTHPRSRATPWVDADPE